MQFFNMLNYLRQLTLIVSKRKRFLEICKRNSLNLNYLTNKDGYEVLKSIFMMREYSDFFPFYRKATVIDIGAHYGYFSIFAGNNLQKDSKIYSVEPGKQNFMRLKKNICDCKLNNIYSFNIAIGDRNGTSKLFSGSSVNNSIIDDYAMSKTSGEYEETEIRTLETFIDENRLDKIDFLKMDCEGAEYIIIESTPKKVFDNIETISLEFHDLKKNNINAERIINKLAGCGFKIVKYNYENTSMNLNYGKMIGTKILN